MLANRLVTELAIAAAATAATAGIIANAAYGAQSQLFGRTLIAGNDPNQAALTYDDGPNDVATLALLELLSRHNTRATFFMIGRFVRQRPEIVREVHAAGHLIANHTDTHPWLTWMPANKVREELRRCNEALEDAIGAPIHYFRAPHGARRPAVLRVAREIGLTPVQWNVMGHDWQPIGADGILQCIDNGLNRVRKQGRGANILLHDGSDRAMGADRSATIAVTSRLLERFATNGIRTVTIDAWG